MEKTSRFHMNILCIVLIRKKQYYELFILAEREREKKAVTN